MLPSIFCVVLFSSARALPSNGRIFGGVIAPEGIAPYQVSLNYRGIHVCGGSILNRRWLVTAAHCFKYSLKPTDYTIRAGSNIKNGGGVVIEIEQVIEHQKYKVYEDDNGLMNFLNDIGLIKVATDILFSDKIQPVQLPDKDTPGGLNVRATGWGRANDEGMFPDNLQVVNLTTISTGDCIEKLATENVVVLTSHLCTISKDGIGLCEGDSGGPLVFNNQLVGVTSYGTTLCARGYPDAFTRVYSHIDWIQSQIAIRDTSDQYYSSFLDIIMFILSYFW